MILIPPTFCSAYSVKQKSENQLQENKSIKFGMYSGASSSLRADSFIPRPLSPHTAEFANKMNSRAKAPASYIDDLNRRSGPKKDKRNYKQHPRNYTVNDLLAHRSQEEAKQGRYSFPEPFENIFLSIRSGSGSPLSVPMSPDTTSSLSGEVGHLSPISPISPYLRLSSPSSSQRGGSLSHSPRWTSVGPSRLSEAPDPTTPSRALRATPDRLDKPSVGDRKMITSGLISEMDHATQVNNYRQISQENSNDFLNYIKGLAKFVSVAEASNGERFQNLSQAVLKFYQHPYLKDEVPARYSSDQSQEFINRLRAHDNAQFNTTALDRSAVQQLSNHFRLNVPLAPSNLQEFKTFLKKFRTHVETYNFPHLEAAITHFWQKGQGDRYRSVDSFDKDFMAILTDMNPSFRFVRPPHDLRPDNDAVENATAVWRQFYEPKQTTAPPPYVSR